MWEPVLPLGGRPLLTRLAQQQEGHGAAPLLTRLVVDRLEDQHGLVHHVLHLGTGGRGLEEGGGGFQWLLNTQLHTQLDVDLWVTSA